MQRFFSGVTRNLWLLPAWLLCAGWAGAAGAACDGLAVDDAWVPAPPPGVSVLAGYFEVTNTSDAVVRVTGVSSPQFARADMHKTVVDDDGMATMRPVDTVTLAPGESVVFEQGSYHVMLFEPAQALAAGDTVTLALHCGASEASLAVTAEVRNRMSMEMGMSHQGPMHHGMDHGDMQHGMAHGQMKMDHGMEHGQMHMDHGMGHGHMSMEHDMDHSHMHHDG